MIIHRSSKYQDGQYWHEGRKVDIQRVFGGIAFKGLNKFTIAIGEETFIDQSHYFILSEGETEVGESVLDLLSLVTTIEARYKVKRWYGRVDENVKQSLAIYNKMMYNSGNKNITVMNVPHNGEYIDETLSLVHVLTRSEDKRLHFHNESMTTPELRSLPTRDLRADEYPRSTALCCAIWGMLRYTNELVRESDITPEVEGDF